MYTDIHIIPRYNYPIVTYMYIHIVHDMVITV